MKIPVQVSRRWRGLVALALALAWSGFFLNEAMHRWARWQMIAAFYAPVYPRGFEADVQALKKASDPMLPLALAALPLVLLVLGKGVAWAIARHRMRRRAPAQGALRD